MKGFTRLLIYVLIVSIPAQSGAAPMICGSENGMESTITAHAHDSSHAHQTDTHHDTATHDPSSSLDQTSSDCASDCECGHCNVTVALSDNEHAAVDAYRNEHAAMCDSALSPYLPSIFRPPISG